MWSTSRDFDSNGGGSACTQRSQTEKWQTEEIELRKPIIDRIGVWERIWRRSASGEYRTYFQIGQSWGVNESTAYRIIRQIEDTVIKSRAFTLPGKKKLQTSDAQIEMVVVDVTETPIEHPKKTT